MTAFTPRFTITNRMTTAITQIERARGFLEAARLSDDWVRDNGMDMTGWIDYFITGLETQMVEVKKRGEQVIRRDVLVQKHGLNERQSKAMEYLLQHGKLTIKDFEVFCPEVNRRSLQRDLNGFLGKGLIFEVGASPTDPTRHYVLSEL